jgi:acetolactate synthase I/II/III large subunit
MQQPVARASNSPEFSTAYYFLEGLNEVGIEYLFCNFGTDHAPIIEEMAHKKKLGEKMPTVIRCPHENTAAHMAGGFAFMTGRGQGVLVHVDVGTANSANAMHNIFRTRLPVLLMAGKAPYTTGNELVGSRDTYVHFVQEPFDQASLVRPYLKWEWTLPSGVVVKEALRRAHSIMQSEPAGPVYLMMQRETLTQHWSVDEVRKFSADQFGSTSGGQADPKLVGELANRIVNAEHPILITAYAGRNPQAVQAIAELSELAGVAVIESNSSNNIPNTLPCFVGYSAEKQMPQADLGILVDIDVPWFPSDVQPKAGSYWAHIDIDILKPASPMWTFPGNLRMQGDSGRILTQLLEELKKKATPAFKQKAASRVEKLKAEHAAFVERAAKLAADKGKKNEINPHYLLSELNKVLDAKDVVFNEAIRNAAAVSMQIKRPQANTMMRSAGGGLGWSGGFALGAKLAAPDHMMVQVVGDGSFYFGNPSSVFSASQQYKLPILIVVTDNTGWGAVKASTLRVFPKGEAVAADEFQSKLLPDVDFSKIAEAFGAYGEKITDPDEVPAALARCAKEVRGGRTAILHARVTRL